MKYVLNAIESSQHCQRNWDLSREVELHHIELFKDILSKVPSKQNIAYYKVHLITDRDKIQKFYSISETRTRRAEHPDEFDELQKITNDFYNPQLLANLVVAFEDWWGFSPNATANYQKRMLQNQNIARYKDLTVNLDRMQALGIASGLLAFAANYLGYKTGFCRCFDGLEAANILGAENNISLAMGIGYPNPELKHNYHHLDHKQYVMPIPKAKIEIVTHTG